MTNKFFSYLDDEWEVQGMHNSFGLYEIHVARTSANGFRFLVIFNEKFEAIMYRKGTKVFDVSSNRIEFENQVKEFAEFGRRVRAMRK